MYLLLERLRHARRAAISAYNINVTEIDQLRESTSCTSGRDAEIILP